MKWFVYINPCIFSICKIFQQNSNNENGNEITNGKGGSKNVNIHCQNGHGNGKTSNLKYFTNLVSNGNIFCGCVKI
jgi:hypothetical protein